MLPGPRSTTASHIRSFRDVVTLPSPIIGDCQFLGKSHSRAGRLHVVFSVLTRMRFPFCSSNLPTSKASTSANLTLDLNKGPRPDGFVNLYTSFISSITVRQFGHSFYQLRTTKSI